MLNKTTYIKKLFKLNFAGILFPLAILAIMYLDKLNINEFTPYPVLLVALFGSIGLSLIFKPSHRSKLSKMDYDEIIDTKDDSKVNLKVSFGSCVKYVNSEDFKEANISCSFGAMQVYFDNAVTFKDAVINLDVSFAGVNYMFLELGK